MDKRLKEYIRLALEVQRQNCLDDLDEALTCSSCSKEFVLMKVKAYGEALNAITMFADWEDRVSSAQNN